MQSLTAGIALVLVQFSVALVMAGIFTAVPSEKCTRYWAWSGALSALGVMTVVLNAGRPNYFFLVVGNFLLIGGVMLQWWGVQNFYGKRPSPVGWCTALAFCVVYVALLAMDAPVYSRAALASVTCAVLYFGIACSLMRNGSRKRTFGNLLGLLGSLLIVVSCVYRSFVSYQGSMFFLPTTDNSIGVSVVFLVPLVGTQVLAMALLLLYFERMVKRKDYLAAHDDLTGLMNRRAVIAAGEREIDIAIRTGIPLSVAYIDIDHFKSINDRFGHETGDKVLADIARILQKTCRRIDLGGRYGGEEFCVIFPGINAAQAVVAGTRLLDAIRSACFAEVGRVTMSIGIAELSATPESREWNALMKSADDALYQAKAQGRNRLCLAGAPDDRTPAPADAAEQ
ncbi:GGDEF domain-containing protein [Noviherbaspirillum galbum]|uniref:diguanylate cyclase n=1 Tax=Noviherbaspirillum galbum TaxID=2709383 RepID=A0A6B3SUD3_9BURK|nr:GGDEF domain-containing protein [Noviherbaspirillum galbum]NEX64088.1 GGDEF domain-containing protein [Noviherbaspirillum galbum]